MTNAIAAQRVQNLKDRRNGLIAKVMHSNMPSQTKRAMQGEIRRITAVLGQSPIQGVST